MSASATLLVIRTPLPLAAAIRVTSAGGGGGAGALREKREPPCPGASPTNTAGEGCTGASAVTFEYTVIAAVVVVAEHDYAFHHSVKIGSVHTQVGTASEPNDAAQIVREPQCLIRGLSFDQSIRSGVKLAVHIAR
jgi:hypothetical protein